MNSLGILLQSNGMSVSFGDINNKDHNTVLGEIVATNDQLKYIDYDKSKMFYDNAVQMALTDNIVTICNITTCHSNEPYVCDSIVVYSPMDLSNEQREIMNLMYDDFKKKKIALFAIVNSDGKITENFLDDYYQMINGVNKVKKIKP